MIRFAVYRPIATAMTFIAITILGLISFSQLEVALFPKLVFPKIYLITSYPGVAPEEMEDLITRPVEEAVSSINNIRTVRSRSQEGISSVEVGLEWGASLNVASVNLRQKIDMIRHLLPEEASRTIIVRFDPATEPILTFIARPLAIPFTELRDFVQKQLQPLLERAEGAASVSIWGGYQREIQVDVDRDKIYALGISLEQIDQVLNRADFRQPVGTIKEGKQELNVRLEGGFQKVADIGLTAITANRSGQPILLNRLAVVRDGFRDRQRAALYNGERAVIVAVRQEPDKNLITTAGNIKKIATDINRSFAKKVRLDLIQDQSVYVENAITDLKKAILLGAIGAFLVLLFFLRKTSSALIVISSIPFAILLTFILMRLFDLSLNIISLGGISLSLGLLVDNAIVVLESIEQQLGRKHLRNRDLYDRREVILKAVREVSTSITVSTLTSVIVFAPLIFVSGLAAQLFGNLALTVSFSLIGSLLIAFTLIPMLCWICSGKIESKVEDKVGGGKRIISLPSKRLAAERPTAERPAAERPAAERLSAFVFRFYERGIELTLHSPGKLLGLLGFFCAVGVFLLLPLEKRLFPERDRGIVEAEIELPAGSSLEQSIELHKKIHLYLLRRGLVKHAVSDIGYENEDLSSLLKGVQSINLSQTTFYIEKGKIDSQQFILYIQKLLEETGELRSSLRKKSDPLQELVGEDNNQLFFDIESRNSSIARQAALFIYRQLRDQSLFHSLHSTAAATLPQVKIGLDREKLAALGLLPAEVATGIYQALHGTVAATYRHGDREIGIRLRLRKKDRDQVEQMKHLYIPIHVAADNGASQRRQIELGTLIDLQKGYGHTTILRKDQQRLERIKIGLEQRNEKEALSLLKSLQRQAKERFPEIQIKIHRQNEETLRSLKDLLFTLLLSAILVYLLLAAQFESLLHPLGLACSIPMMLPGVALGLLIGGHSLNINSVTGMIILTGLAINSAALLYEKIGRQKNKIISATNISAANTSVANIKEHLPHILKISGQRRLRPILITTFTTFLSLLPLALGMGGKLQASMAVAVIGGLFSVGLFTLFLFPTLYYLLELLRIWIKHKLKTQ